MSDLMRQPATTRYSGKLIEISAAAEANLDERGIPKKLGRLARKAKIAGYDKDARTVTMAVSSETPVDRYFGEEILSHEAGAIRTGRLEAGVALLFNHEYDLHLGRSLSFEQDGGNLRVTCKFGSNPLAREKEQDVADDILVDVSIGYIVHQWDITEDPKTGFRTYTAVDWELLEVSLVTVPADPTVGVGRSSEEMPVTVRSFRTLESAETREQAASEDDEDEDDEDDDEEDTEGTGSEDERSLTPSTPETPNPTQEQKTPMAASAGVDHTALNQERITGLRALRTTNPTHFSESDLLDAISGDTTVSDAKQRLADKIIAAHASGSVATTGADVIGRMSEKEQKAYSLRNVYCAAVNEAKPGTFKDKGAEAGFEREVSSDLKRAAEERGTRTGAGIMIPSLMPFDPVRAAQQRAVTAGSGGANIGPNSIIPTIQPGLIELLRAQMVALRLGARYLPGLFGTPRFLRQNATASSSWLAEMAAVSPTDPGLDFIGMSPKRLSMASSFTLDVLIQSPVAVEDMLRADRTEVLARSLDQAIVAGPGSNNVPLGLVNYTGIAAVLPGATKSGNTVTPGAGNAPLTYLDVNQFEATISTANGNIGTMGWAYSNRIHSNLRTTQKFPGVASDPILPDSPLSQDGSHTGPFGYKAISSSAPYLANYSMGSGGSQVNNLHLAVLGVWDQLLVGDWGVNEVISDNITGAASAIFKVFEHGYYDVNVRHQEAFAIATTVAPY